MAKKPKPARTRPASVPPGREAPGVELSAAVAIEHANTAVNAPVPPAVQDVLDADPTATAKARQALADRIAAQPPAVDDDEDGPSTPETPPATDPAAGSKE